MGRIVTAAAQQQLPLATRFRFLNKIFEFTDNESNDNSNVVS